MNENLQENLIKEVRSSIRTMKWNIIINVILQLIYISGYTASIYWFIKVNNKINNVEKKLDIVIEKFENVSDEKIDELKGLLK